MKIIKEINKDELREQLYSINIEDKSIYDELNKGNTIGIFQLNGSLASDIVKQIKPRSFADLNACSALSRPGTSSFVEDYIKGRDEGFRKYPEQISQLLEMSNTIVLYQEQVMSIFNRIGGFSLEETDNIRKLMKRLGKAEKDPEDVKKWDKAVKKFTKGSIEAGLSEIEAKNIADDLLKMSAYSFNLSHASAYSYIAVMTLYLSYYFKKYFLTAELEYEINKTGSNLIDIFSSIRGQKFDILPPDINKSDVDVVPLDDDKLILGLSNIKQVSKRAASHIIEVRPVNNLFEFITKVDGRLLKINGIKALVSVGAFDFENPNRKQMLQILNTFWEKKKSIKVVEKLKIKWDEAKKSVENLPGVETTLMDLKNYEKEYLGGNFFASVFDDKMKSAFVEMRNKKLINLSFDEVGKISRKVPVVIDSIRKIVDKNGNEMAFLSVEDVQGKVISIPVFASFWKYIGQYFEEDEMYLINMYLDDKDSILFGQKGWIDSPGKIRRMVKAL